MTKKKTEQTEQPETQLAPADESISAWWAQFPGDEPIKVRLSRMSPKTFQGQNTSGVVDTLDEMVEEDEIQARYGGGKYQLKAFRLGKKGQWEYWQAKNFDIAGAPKISNGTNGAQVAPLPAHEADPGLIKHAMQSAERSADAERARADRLEEERAILLREANQPQDTSILQAMVKSQGDQLIAMLSSQNRPDPMLEKVLSGDISQAAKLKDLHEAELRTLRENQREDIKRVENRYEHQIATMQQISTQQVTTSDAGHQREITALKSAYDVTRIASDGSWGAQKTVFEHQITSLREELGMTRTELVELRSKKDVSMEDQLVGMVKLKEALSILGGGNDDESSGVLDKLLEVAGPLVEGIGRRVAEGPVTNPQAQAQQQAEQAQAAQAAQVQAQQQAEDAAGFSVADVKQAVSFLENAVNNKTDPAMVVASAQQLLPRKLMNMIQEKGLEFFLSQVDLDTSSVLKQQIGRTFIRKVDELLKND